MLTVDVATISLTGMTADEGSGIWWMQLNFRQIGVVLKVNKVCQGQADGFSPRPATTGGTFTDLLKSDSTRRTC